MASAGVASVFSYNNLVHALAGASGSVTAMTVFFPLDTARLRLQVDDKRNSKSTAAILKEIVEEEGLQAVYRGWLPVITSLCCSNFVYFYTFNTLKTFWLDQKNKSNPGKDMLMGFISGAVNVLLTTPMWVVNTRLKLQGAKFRNDHIQQTNYKGMIDAFRQIIEREGVKALWNGTLPSLILVFNPAIQFMIYEGLKRQANSGKIKLNAMDIFIIGAIAKATATAATFPLQTVQSILRFGQYESGSSCGIFEGLKNILHLITRRVRQQGVTGLYKGLEAKLLQTVLTAALMFVLYEKIAALIFRLMGLNLQATHR